jgi:hypothetical protein
VTPAETDRETEVAALRDAVSYETLHRDRPASQALPGRSLHARSASFTGGLRDIDTSGMKLLGERLLAGAASEYERMSRPDRSRSIWHDCEGINGDPPATGKADDGCRAGDDLTPWSFGLGEIVVQHFARPGRLADLAAGSEIIEVAVHRGAGNPEHVGEPGQLPRW